MTNQSEVPATATRIRAEFRTTPMDEGLNREALAGLQRDLVELGVDPAVTAPTHDEFRNVSHEVLQVAHVTIPAEDDD